MLDSYGSLIKMTLYDMPGISQLITVSDVLGLDRRTQPKRLLRGC